MRIGIIALLHESNTFVRKLTNFDRFRDDLFLRGDAIRDSLGNSHHEIGGFFAGVDEWGDSHVVAEPLVALRATPSGVINAEAFETLCDLVIESVQSANRLDGILVAAHGAAVSQNYADADGEWLSRLRDAMGIEVPIMGTLDAHANLSERMIASCDALVAYRTNPHLDQRDRGREAARLMIATLRNEIRPTMAAAYPPMLISIQRQCTDDLHLRSIYQIADQQLQEPRVLSNSVLLGFPYADVPEMAAASIVVTNNDTARARELAAELGHRLWEARQEMHGHLIDVDEAIESCRSLANGRVCLLDMGDNVGGGSAADGTILARELWQHNIGPAVACIYDPQAVTECVQANVGTTIQLSIGGKTDEQHGPPLDMKVKVRSLHDGRFREDQPRHGGIVDFDQGRCAVVQSAQGDITLLLTSRRTAPFSLRQLTSCDIDPMDYRVLVAKGVNAPLAAYKEVCHSFIRVNTAGSTCADVTRMTYKERRKPLFPFEAHTQLGDLN